MINLAESGKNVELLSSDLARTSGLVLVIPMYASSFHLALALRYRHDVPNHAYSTSCTRTTPAGAGPGVGCRKYARLFVCPGPRHEGVHMR